MGNVTFNGMGEVVHINTQNFAKYSMQQMEYYVRTVSVTITPITLKYVIHIVSGGCVVTVPVSPTTDLGMNRQFTL